MHFTYTFFAFLVINSVKTKKKKHLWTNRVLKQAHAQKKKTKQTTDVKNPKPTKQQTIHNWTQSPI